MSKNLLARYTWIIDTIRRHGAITRQRLDELWILSSVGDGKPLSRRTFYNYRNAIEDLFDINIEVNKSTYEYSIQAGDSHHESVTDWLLNSAAVHNVLSSSTDVSDRIFLEDVPSARIHLSTVISALRGSNLLRFTYRPYTRVNPKRDVVVEPYFLKIFRQRWYVTGRNVADDAIKTYALDRMEDVIIDSATFALPPDFDAEDFVRPSFGIIFTQGVTYRIRIRVDARQAKYLRTLPLHPSQDEASIHDKYSIFTYDMRLTPDLVQEIVARGPSIKVEEPEELRLMVRQHLADTLAQYDEQGKDPSDAR